MDDKNIRKTMQEFNKTIESLLPEVEEATNQLIKFIENNKIDFLVKKEIKNKENEKYVKEIESTIERALDYLMNSYTKKYFDEILSSWEELNPKSAKDYKIFYKENWED